MDQHEVNALYELALDVQLQDHKVGRVLAHLVRHLAATEGLEPDLLKEAPPEEQTPATDVDMHTAPLGEDHSQVPTSGVPYPSRESPVGLDGEPITRFEDEDATEKREAHRGGRGRKKVSEGNEFDGTQEPLPTDIGLRGPQEGE